MRPTVLSATTLIGDDVTNLKDEDLGSLEDLMINVETGRIQYAVLSFGGILGLGEKYFAVPWQSIHVDTDEEELVLNVDREVLENSEGFDKDDWPNFASLAGGDVVGSGRRTASQRETTPTYKTVKVTQRRVIWRLKDTESDTTPR